MLTKKGLDNTYALDDYFHHPTANSIMIHVAGTNGKGSCSYTLAAILQAAGYKTGLILLLTQWISVNVIRVNGNLW